MKEGGCARDARQHQSGDRVAWCAEVVRKSTGPMTSHLAGRLFAVRKKALFALSACGPERATRSCHADGFSRLIVVIYLRLLCMV